ncbi:MFS transporter [Alteromonas sp. a30]|uniref:MFS transporter n=1 Tax=Alteromonas sp. a30 TaxID=2730917 RepID=UPI002282132B|nr:MFS transporter [Alteromonas sp. a30]MCY7294681.1 MFS transporter [Alteromonas sp. a30]
MENAQYVQNKHETQIDKLRVMAILISSYVLFAILLNSVGTVILQSISSFGVSKTNASVLEGFKDIPIAIVSFFVAAYLPRFGFKRAMLTSTLLVTVGSLLMPLLSNFFMSKMLFLIVGASFALIKISVYALIGRVSDNQQAHASNMNIVEGCFMVGVLAGYWLFSAFIDPTQPESYSWLNVYWLIAFLGAANLLLIVFTHVPEVKHLIQSESPQAQFAGMLKLVWLPFVVMFIICAFFYVLVEQGIGTWLPTFNSEVLNLANHISVQVTSIFAACLAAGRLLAGYVLRKMHWFNFLVLSLFLIAALILIAIPLANSGVSSVQIQSWSDVPIAAFVLPLVGLFMAPIYPAINSVVLSALPSQQHASMTGLIVVFSALGGTFGSLVTGAIFEYFSGQTAFYFMLVPIAILTIALFLYKRLLTSAPITEATA